MANPSIRQSLISLDPVYLATTDDDTRLICDRYVIWKLDHAPLKLREATRHLPDGAYKLTAGGAVTALGEGTPMPTFSAFASLLPEEYTEPAERLPLVADHQRGGARVYSSKLHGYVGVDNRLDLAGYTLHDTAKKKFAILTRRGELAGAVMQIRLSTLPDPSVLAELDQELAQEAAHA